MGSQFKSTVIKEWNEKCSNNHCSRLKPLSAVEVGSVNEFMRPPPESLWNNVGMSSNYDIRPSLS